MQSRHMHTKLLQKQSWCVQVDTKVGTHLVKGWPSRFNHLR